MALADTFRNLFSGKSKSYTDQAHLQSSETDGVFKAFVSNSFLYKPPYGFPRMVNLPALRELAKTPYIYMVTKTIIDECVSVEWDVVPKPHDEPRGVSEPFDDVKKETYKRAGAERASLAHIKEVKHFLNHPNLNGESFEFIMRAVLRDVLEVDSGVIVKVFNRQEKLKQMFARDGSTFLRNPDVHGYMGDKADFVFLPDFNNEQSRTTYFNTILKQEAAFFQYGWVAMMPIPFGRREIGMLQMNSRSDSIYGLSPLEVLQQIIHILVYGSQFNMDFYTNNNMPDGVIQLLGANQQQIQAFRERFEKQFKKKDDYGTWRKVFHKYPIVNNEAKFTPFQLKPAEMEIIQQQEWFSKLVWACFGVTPSELGFTENSNRAVDLSQSKVFKRKAVKPLLRLYERFINDNILCEFGFDDVEFRFIEYDLDEDLNKHKLYEIQLKNGLRSVNEVREDMGLPVVEGGDDLQKQGGGFGEEEEVLEDKPDDEQKEEGVEGKVLESLPPLTLQAGEKPTKKKVESILLDFFKIKQDLLLDEIQKIYESDKLVEVKDFMSLWTRILKSIETLFPAGELKTVIMDFVKKSFGEGLEVAELSFAQNFFPNQPAIDFLSDYNFDLIKNMTEELSNKLKSTLQRSYMNDKPFSEVKDEVKELFKTNEARAKSIVRTEQNRAQNVGRLEGARQSKLVKGKSLLNALDHRTTPLCKRMISKYGDKIIGLDEKFVDDQTGESWLNPPFHVNCLRAGTKIITQQGKKNVEDVQVGDYALTAKKRYKKVTRTMKNNTKQIFKIKTNNSEVFITGDHPVMTSAGWKLVKDLTDKDWVMGI